MSTAPLSRDEQIRFMKEAPARHAAVIARWMADPEISAMLSQRVERVRKSEFDDAEKYLKARHA